MGLTVVDAFNGLPIYCSDAAGMGIMEFMSEPISNAYRQLSQNRSYYLRPNNFHLNSTIFDMEPFIKDVDKIRGRRSKMHIE